MARLFALLLAGLLLVSCGGEPAAPSSGETPAGDFPGHPVGLRQIEFTDAEGPDGPRRLALSVFYPGRLPAEGAETLAMPFFGNVHVYPDPAPIDDRKHPLILFSHGRGSNPLNYAWFAEALAGRGYLVAGINHYRANSFESDIAYLANRLYQRPKDLSLAVDHLLGDDFWGPLIDGDRIGVAGHSQGGFTALWLSGAKVGAREYRAFQQGVKNNPMIPASVRARLPVDPGPALAVADPRIRAAFAMAPGVIEDFGMTEAGLAASRTPTYLIVGARDTQTPPATNAELAAAHIPGAQLNILAGDVDHEIFVNECSPIGRDELPEACIDAPGVDRAALHRDIAEAAVGFFDEQLRGR